MVNVRFFGMIRTVLRLKNMEIDADSIDEMLKIIADENISIQYEELKNSLILVNGKNIDKLDMMKTSLNEGDQVEIFSPIIGG